MKIAWKRQTTTRWAVWSYRLGGFSLPMLAIAVLAHRAQISIPHDTMAALGAAFGVGLAGVLIGMVALVRIWNHGFNGLGAACAGISCGFATLIGPLIMVPLLFTLPRIHDVSTDLEKPLEFVQALQARPTWANDVRTTPPEVREAQRAAYPALVSLRVDQTAAETFLLATQMVEKRGWRFLDRRAPDQTSSGRIEAVARTLLLGFEDDIVIRITPSGSETRIDMRSASRFGTHDFGANANRISSFLLELRDRAAER